MWAVLACWKEQSKCYSFRIGTTRPSGRAALTRRLSSSSLQETRQRFHARNTARVIGNIGVLFTANEKKQLHNCSRYVLATFSTSSFWQPCTVDLVREFNSKHVWEIRFVLFCMHAMCAQMCLHLGGWIKEPLNTLFDSKNTADDFQMKKQKKCLGSNPSLVHFHFRALFRNGPSCLLFPAV